MIQDHNLFLNEIQKEKANNENLSEIVKKLEDILKDCDYNSEKTQSVNNETRKNPINNNKPDCCPETSAHTSKFPFQNKKNKSEKKVQRIIKVVENEKKKSYGLQPQKVVRKEVISKIDCQSVNKKRLNKKTISKSKLIEINGTTFEPFKKKKIKKLKNGQCYSFCKNFCGSMSDTGFKVKKKNPKPQKNKKSSKSKQTDTNTLYTVEHALCFPLCKTLCTKDKPVCGKKVKCKAKPAVKECWGEPSAAQSSAELPKSGLKSLWEILDLSELQMFYPLLSKVYLGCAKHKIKVRELLEVLERSGIDKCTGVFSVKTAKDLVCQWEKRGKVSVDECLFSIFWPLDYLKACKENDEGYLLLKIGQWQQKNYQTFPEQSSSENLVGAIDSSLEDENDSELEKQKFKEELQHHLRSQVLYGRNAAFMYGRELKRFNENEEMKKYKDSPFAPSNYMREMNWLTEDIKRYNRFGMQPVINKLPLWHPLGRVAKNPQDKTLHPNKWKEKGTNMRSAPRGPVTHNSNYSYRSEGPARDARGKPRRW